LLLLFVIRHSFTPPCLHRYLLNRGARLTELLKQNQYVPMPFQDQVICIYAGTRGYLDKLAVSDVGPYQEKLLAHTKASASHLLDQIKKEGEINADLDAQLKDLMVKFTAEFTA